MKFPDRILRSIRWRLWRHAAGIRVWRLMERCLGVIWPYTPRAEEISAARARSRYASETRPSTIPGAGMGLFALEDIPANVILGEYCGDFIPSTFRTMRLRNSDYLAFTGIPWLYIDALRHPEVMVRYINHHPDPESVNVRLRQQEEAVFFDTTRPIRRGEEFFTDYGDIYWKLRNIPPSALGRPPATARSEETSPPA